MACGECDCSRRRSSKSGHASVVHSGAPIRGDYEVEASTAVGGDRAASRTTPRMGLDGKFESLVLAAKSSTGGPSARAKLGCFWGILQVLDMPMPCPHPPLYRFDLTSFFDQQSPSHGRGRRFNPYSAHHLANILYFQRCLLSNFTRWYSLMVHPDATAAPLRRSLCRARTPRRTGLRCRGSMAEKHESASAAGEARRTSSVAPIARAPSSAPNRNITEKQSGAAGDITIVRPASAAPPGAPAGRDAPRQSLRRPPAKR